MLLKGKKNDIQGVYSRLPYLSVRLSYFGPG